jgi:hypothetical protein
MTGNSNRSVCQRRRPGPPGRHENSGPFGVRPFRFHGFPGTCPASPTTSSSRPERHPKSPSAIPRRAERRAAKAPRRKGEPPRWRMAREPEDRRPRPRAHTHPFLAFSLGAVAPWRLSFSCRRLFEDRARPFRPAPSRTASCTPRPFTSSASTSTLGFLRIRAQRRALFPDTSAAIAGTATGRRGERVSTALQPTAAVHRAAGTSAVPKRSDRLVTSAAFF